MNILTQSLLVFLTMITSLFGAEKEQETDTVIFDVVNVLTRLTEKDAIHYLQSQIDISNDDICNIVKAYKKEKVLRNIQDFDEELFWEIFGAVYSKDVPEDLPANFNKFIDTHAIIDGEMLRDMIDLKLKGYSVGLLANLNPFLYTALEKQGFFEHFDVCVTSTKDHICKPCNSAFEKFLEKSQKEASQCVIIDSNQKSLSVAKALGFKTVYFNIHEESPEHLKQLLVNAIVNRFCK